MDYKQEIRDRDTLAGAEAPRQGQMKNDEVNPVRVAMQMARAGLLETVHNNCCLQYV